MLQVIFYIIALQAIYYTVKSATRRAYTDFFNGMSIDINYNNDDEEHKDMDELD